MEDEDFFDLLSLVDRFNEMLSSRDVQYFDVDQFEAVSDYYYELGKVSKALKVIEIAAEQHPYHHSFYFRKIQYLTAGNHTSQARREIDKLAEHAPDSLELHLARASLFSKLGQHQKAIHHYRESLQLSDFPEEIWSLLALEYQLIGNYEKAKKYLKLSLEVIPDDEISIYNLALCFDLLEKSEEGISYFEKFIDLNPYSEIAWYHLGIMHTRQKEYEQALRAFDYALLIDEYFSAAYFEKARTLERTFRYKEAAEVYEETFEIDGPTGFAYYKIGLCYLQMHQRKKALSNFTKAIREDDELDEAFFELALMKDEDEQWDEAVFYMSKALELDPDNPEYMSVNADILRRAGKLDEAEIQYELLVEHGVTDARVFIDYAELLFDMCEFDNGMEVLYSGLQHNETSAEMNYRVAGYLYTLQENDEADIYFEKGLKLDADRRRYFFELFPKLKNHPAVKRIMAATLR